MKELINYLEERYSTEEIWQLLDDYNDDYLRDYYLQNDICPLCGGMVFTHKWKENRGEYFGFPAYEDMWELKCSNCGETY